MWMTLTLTTHTCFSPGRTEWHCFTVLPVEGFCQLLSPLAFPSTPGLYLLLSSCTRSFSPVKSKQELSRPSCHVSCCTSVCVPGVGAARCLLTPSPRAPVKSRHYPSAAVWGIPFTQTKRKRWLVYLCPIPDVTLQQLPGLGMVFNVFTVDIELQFCFFCFF